MKLRVLLAAIVLLSSFGASATVGELGPLAQQATQATIPPGYQEVARTPSFIFVTQSPDPPRAVLTLAGAAEELFAPIARLSGYQPEAPAVVILTLDHQEFRALGYPSWAVGIAQPERNLIALSLRDRRGMVIDPFPTFRHELSHLALIRAAGRGELPRWFIEGLATWQSEESPLAREKELLEAARSGGLLNLSELEEGFPTDDTLIGRAYAQSAAFMRYLVELGGPEAPAGIVRRVAEGGSFGVAVQAELGKTLRELEAGFLSGLRQQTSWLPFLTDSGLLWGLMTLLFVFGYIKKRRELRRRLLLWEQEEQEPEGWEPWPAWDQRLQDGTEARFIILPEEPQRSPGG